MATMVLSVVLYTLSICPSGAQNTYLFKTLDAQDGLTSSQVNCILKDSRGFMWFGTPAGLYRYDGYTFRNFQCNSQDGSSLPDSYINSIQEALDGTLWIETNAGYCIYHPQTESFERDMKQTCSKMNIERVPSIIFIDRHKNLWGAIPNKGVVCYNMQQQQMFEFGYTDDAQGVPQGNICSISDCRDGALIVYEDGRIVCCDVMHQQHTVWGTSEIANRKLRRTKSLKAFADQMDNIWLYGQGTLFMYNKSANLWDTSIGDRLGLTGIGVDNAVNGMGGDKDGNIWIGTDRSGLIRMNMNSREMEPVQPRNINIDNHPEDLVRIQSIYIDDTDLIWVGTEKSGIAYSGKNIYRFGTSLLGDVTAIAQDGEGHVWYGTSDRGLVGYNGPLASQKVSSMVYTKDGSLWVGSRQNGLTRIKGGSTTIYSVAKDSLTTIIDDHVNALCTDKVGNLWIATNGGLQVFNPRMNAFSTYTRENGKLSTNSITALHYATNNRMLIGTSEGLIIMSLASGEMKLLTGNTTNIESFTNNYVTQVYEDSRGLIWVGTREGVNILNLETDNLSYLTKHQGLSNNNICGITEDKNNNIWLTTSNGVSRVVVQRNHEDGTFVYGLYNYTTDDGLQSNEFNTGSILSKADGTVILGGLYGTNWPHQTTGSDTDALPKVMLTQLFVGEEEIQTGHEYSGKVILPSALNETNRLELLNSQNTFTIKFSAGNYNQSERLQFMYWMEGLDKDWRNGDAMKHGVTFTNLGFGTYRLHVKAVSAEGAVSDQERVLEIEIGRPWYISWWMMAIYAAAIIIILYMWKIGIRQVRAIKSKKEAIISELKHQREEIKSASEDLRHPMARMTTIIGNLSEKNMSLEEREQLNALHSQMLQVITRVSDMQSALEHPDVRAKMTVNNKYELNSKGELELPEVVTGGLSTDVQTSYASTETSKFVVIFIDDNKEFLQFASARLKNVYDFHAYNDIHLAAKDLEAINADIIVCKQDMNGMTGSELCNNIKTQSSTHRTKFVLMTEGVLTPQDMRNMNITLSADDYLAKPFNMQEAVMRFNKLLGLGPIEVDSNLIEGSETRRLEKLNSSMTTSTESLDLDEYAERKTDQDAQTDTIADEMELVDISIRKQSNQTNYGSEFSTANDDEATEYFNEYSMADAMERHLLKSIEQYVLQNMSRGQISLEEMATAMGMGRVPFFHKVRSLTNKTPTELVRDIRLKHACILLKRTNINMSELAANVGFMTADNFIRTFKEKFGLSPLEYRLKHRK
jgi:ligand-binding sensor domain-containing protein/AraC-like DNA-binding protein/DNA-binding NarL/FixJ family response regulator